MCVCACVRVCVYMFVGGWVRACVRVRQCIGVHNTLVYVCERRLLPTCTPFRTTTVYPWFSNHCFLFLIPVPQTPGPVPVHPLLPLSDNTVEPLCLYKASYTMFYKGGPLCLYKASYTVFYKGEPLCLYKASYTMFYKRGTVVTVQGKLHSVL